MIEDQLAPKRCGHTPARGGAARRGSGAHPRGGRCARRGRRHPDPRAHRRARPLGFDEALWRVPRVRDLGADILFLEAPRTEREMERVLPSSARPRWRTWWSRGSRRSSAGAARGARLQIAAYPLTLLAAATRAMQQALAALRGEARAPATSGSSSCKRSSASRLRPRALALRRGRWLVGEQLACSPRRAQTSSAPLPPARRSTA